MSQRQSLAHALEREASHLHTYPHRNEILPADMHLKGNDSSAYLAFNWASLEAASAIPVDIFMYSRHQWSYSHASLC
ncbi:hypothetical protein ASPTUDRAFT_49340 [Aspergillus tubingensis CBS 134.48]|uniref:Uncharacterized protein n=1 Tax=Aspergillus tubingensis (strain CBS 134.48) TaxID=767770 RepID=A0A1L9NK20_ASPTC|nr:hypothetical protein ASPTUDRAFT_49340 [Aspergillus tubingensis CBS 134.48]